jgi:LmbE family N-acetylglucosaminyl deacetylase
MQKLFISFTIFSIFTCNLTQAQQPVKPSSAEIYNQIQKLNFLGSVLYIAAHPDDENTRLISYFSNEVKARTAYLSLTRGDGGQNLIGPQLRELLGVIRTQELIQARKIDGGEQLFTRANDFGFSKNAEETLQIWDQEMVLADIVFAIRKFQPDIIINRFDHRTSGNTHGHHSASAMLSFDSFGKANDVKAFPEQLNFTKIWKTTRQFFNPSWWFYGSQEKFKAADKSSFLALQTGVFYPTIGKSNQEIAALSRSCHQSQGFGTTGTRGEESEYLELINGDFPQDKKNIFDGIDTSWNRIKGGKPIGELIDQITKDFDFKNPANSIPDLVKAYVLIQVLDDNHWKSIKSLDIKNCIAACAGLYLEASTQNQEATAGTSLEIKIEAINRSEATIKLLSLTSLPAIKSVPQNVFLSNNVSHTSTVDLILPTDIENTQPYWLKEQGTDAMYRVDNQDIIGIPDVIRIVKLVFNMEINGIEIPIERFVVHKHNNEIKGETHNYLDIVPDITTSFIDKVFLFADKKKKSVAVKIISGKNLLKGDLKLELPENWIVSPKAVPFEIATKGTEKTVYFEVTPPHELEEVLAKTVAIIDDKRYDKEQIIINYDHINKQQVLKSSESKFIRTNLKTNDERIAYIMGAGDEVPKSLIQMGYAVTLLNPEEISTEKMINFDVVMTGVRAFNTVKVLANKQNILFDFVKSGKTMIVQYNTPYDLVTNNLAPFSLKISQDRVTEA